MQSVMKLPESMTVRAIKKFQKDLTGVLNENEKLSLDVSNITETDISFIQIVYAARYHAECHSKEIRLDKPADGAVAALLARGGFTTDPDQADIDFWFHGDLPQ
ncbi:MAG: STAS domain-containing protein [Pseudomonadota bacterium]|jgi:hypothetical protein